MPRWPRVSNSGQAWWVALGASNNSDGASQASRDRARRTATRVAFVAFVASVAFVSVQSAKNRALLVRNLSNRTALPRKSGRAAINGCEQQRRWNIGRDWPRETVVDRDWSSLRRRGALSAELRAQCRAEGVSFIRGSGVRQTGLVKLEFRQQQLAKAHNRRKDVTGDLPYRYIANLSPSSRMRFATRIATLPPFPRKRWRHSLVIGGTRVTER